MGIVVLEEKFKANKLQIENAGYKAVVGIMDGMKGYIVVKEDIDIFSLFSQHDITMNQHIATTRGYSDYYNFRPTKDTFGDWHSHGEYPCKHNTNLLIVPDEQKSTDKIAIWTLLEIK